MLRTTFRIISINIWPNYLYWYQYCESLPLSPSVSFSLSVSLSHTHTQTHLAKEMHILKAYARAHAQNHEQKHKKALCLAGGRKPEASSRELL